MALSIIYI